LRQETVFSGEIFSVTVGEVSLDDGQTAAREVVDHRGGVGVVAIVDDAVVLVRQFRIATGETLLELPAGRLEADESAAQCARRELEEEVGLRAATLVPLLTFYTSPGYSDELLHLFLAVDLTATPRRPEWDEKLEIVRLPLAEIAPFLAQGGTRDAKTLLGLHALLLAQGQQGPR
jgi:ADP-ribose pyrophosphatase